MSEIAHGASSASRTLHYKQIAHRLTTASFAYSSIVFGIAQAAAPSTSDADDTNTTPISTADSTRSGQQVADANDGRPGDLEVVIVSAQKRDERLQDVPVPVTAISAAALTETNQLRLQDYYTSITGLSVTPDDEHGAPVLAIRGITTGPGTPTVGITVDDVPYGSSTGSGHGYLAPDLDPSDLARVEVLRGPQGTLYGASSMGGLLKYVTVDPTMDALSGRIQAGLDSVKNGDQSGYSVRGSVNVPLSDTLAIRASTYSRLDPGYIDDPTLSAKGVNKGEAYGGRLSGLWRPSEDLSLKVNALIQHTRTDGSPDVDIEPGLGDLQQSAVRGTGGFDRTLQAYSATLKANLGRFALTSVSGYNINTSSDVLDYSPVLGFYTDKFFQVTGTPFAEHLKTTKFTEEVRLAGPIAAHIDWLAGLFYTNETSSETQQLSAAVPASGQLVGTWLNDNVPSTFREYAIFTDFTFHLTDAFEVQVGGRESANRQALTESFVGLYDSVFLGLTSPVLYPEVTTKDNSFTYLVTPRYKLTPDVMLYARLASGYRPGGPNTNYQTYGVPPNYSPDTTKNYEIGVKADALDHVLTFDVSLYYIDWKNIQLALVDPSDGASFSANASRAKSQGLEFAVGARPLKGLILSTWVAWNDAQLTAGFPTDAAYGVSGERLPFSSRFSGNASIQQDFPITDRATGYVGGTVSYVGDRLGVFTSTPARQDLPAYAKTDLRAGVKYQSWDLDFYANNVADRRSLLNGGLGTVIPVAFSYIQPRTVGFAIAKSF
jgi:iron complex outermembrane recepter protein